MNSVEESLNYPVELTPEEKEMLKELFESRGWKVYWKYLIAQKNAKVLEAVQIFETNKHFHFTGIVAGLNLAINQLGILVAMFNKPARHVAAESKKQTDA